MYNKNSPVFLVVRLRRKVGTIERQITGTDDWFEIDDQARESLDNEDFRKWNDGKIGWQKHPTDGYEYCLINLRD